MDDRNVATRRILCALDVPWEQIVAAARAEPTAWLVILGSHGRTGVARVLLGSVAEQVVRHAPCSVLVVREPAAPGHR